nr:immunoglobulin heavy chain junction region [Mus musculus]
CARDYYDYDEGFDYW